MDYSSMSAMLQTQNGQQALITFCDIVGLFMHYRSTTVGNRINKFPCTSG